MSTTPNIDNEKAKTTANPKDIASPLPGDSGYVELERSDLRPERIERLGQYLSNTTQNIASADERNATAYGNPETSTMEIPHQSGKPRADYSVSAPGQTAIRFENDIVNEAMDYFRQLSNDIETFSSEAIDSVITPSEKANSPNLKYGSGHSLLNNKAQDVVKTMMEEGAASTMENSRWASIGEKRFPTDGDMFVLNAKERLDNSKLEEGTSFGNYRDPSGHGIAAEDAKGRKVFWDNYFERLSKFGPAMQMKAANQPLSQGGFGGRVLRGGLFNAFGGVDSQVGTYSKIDMGDLDAETIYSEREGEEIEGLKMNHLHPHNSTSWGQLYTHTAPFFPEGFVVADSGALSTVVELTAIFIQMSIQVTLTTAVIEIANYLVASLGEDLGGLWENSYYPVDPQRKDPTDYKKGFSGYRHPLRMDGEKFIEAGGTVTIPGADGLGGVATNQLLGGVLRKAATVLDEEVLNFTQVVARDLNLYIPRHHLSQAKNQTKYNVRTGDILKDAVQETTKVVDIGTAYIRSCTAGFGIVAANILGEFNSKSVGYYKSLFREIVRNTKALEEERQADSVPRSVYQTLLLFLGVENKLMKFMNYLCIIGDTSIATGAAGPMAFPLNKVDLGQVGNHPTLRTASTRRVHSRESRLSLGSLPSLMLKPKNNYETENAMTRAGIHKGSYGRIHALNELHVKTPRPSTQPGVLIKNKYQSRAENRFSPEHVRLIEDQLEAEHMPFYIQDLRTNEIIAFHAFLNSLSDSYTGEWSATKGFGRLEAAQIYGGGSRSIGLSFTLVAMNPEDFDEMYMKINKLTTLVYPQWSEGTLMQQGENIFVQPFSQVPTASPLCRIRVGEIFASNYSKKAMARMMGIENPAFKYEGMGDGTTTVESAEGTGEFIPREKTFHMWKMLVANQIILPQMDGSPGADKIGNEWDKYTSGLRREQVKVQFTEGIAGTGIGGFKAIVSSADDKYSLVLHKSETAEEMEKFRANHYEEIMEVKYETPPNAPTNGMIDLFSTKNPIFKSFESTMGRGIAVAINSIGLEWKLNSAPWNLEPGARAPRMCEVSLGLIPIHDITPGLDHTGINRAPIYKVGSSRDGTGDVWYDDQEFDKLTSDIQNGHNMALGGVHHEKGESE